MNLNNTRGLFKRVLKVSMMVGVTILYFNPTCSARESEKIVLAALFSKEKPKGMFLNMLYTEAFRRLGIDFEYNELPAKRASVMADAGEVDGEISRVYNYLKAHPNLIRIEEPHYMSGIFALAIDPSIELDGWESLKNTKYRVNYKIGIWLIESNLPKYVTSERVETVPHIENGLKKLISGRCDIFVEAESDIISVLGSGFKFSSGEFKDSDVRIAGVMEKYLAHAYLHRKHRKLVPKLAEALRKMKAEGVFEQYRKLTGYETLFKEDGSVKQISSRD